MSSTTVKLPKLQSAGQIRAASYNADKKTVDVCFTTGFKGIRYSWMGNYYEELVVTPEAVRLDRLNAGASVLDTHGSWELANVLGVVEKAWIEGGEGLATIRFSEREDVAPIVADIAAGIIRNVSVGYAVHVYEKTEAAGEKIPTYRATDWEPLEISFVPVPFDPGAQARHRSSEGVFEVEIRGVTAATVPTAPSGAQQEENPMTTPALRGGNANPAQDPAPVVPATQAAPASPAPQSEDQIRAAAATAERERIAEIRSHVRIAKLPDTLADTLINEGVTVDQARSRIFEQWRSQDNVPTATAANLTVTRAEQDSRRDAMSNAIRLRANPKAVLSPVEAEHRQAAEAAREFRGLTLLDMARDCIAAAGGNHRGLSRREVAVVALGLDRNLMTRAGMHSTSDFDNILASTTNRTLRAAYMMAPRTFADWCRRTTAPDFRENSRTQLSDLTAIKSINEGGEYKYLSMSDSAEKYSLAKYGGIIAITWESLINDDLAAFDRLPVMAAEEAAAQEGDVVYNILLDNGNLADAVALFSTAATRLNKASADGAISDTTLGAGRAAMRKQTGPKGRKLNITPEFLIVGPDKESEAYKYTSVSYVAAKSVDINPKFNTDLKVLVDARVTGNKWFLAAAPGRIDTVEYAYLEGEEGLYTEVRQGFEVDGLELKLRLAFAAKAIDFRGLYYNAGA